MASRLWRQMSKSSLTIGGCVLILCGCPPVAQETDRENELRIENESSTEIVVVYISPSWSDCWGSNQISTHIPAQSTRTVTRIPDDIYDVLVRDLLGREWIQWGLALRGGTTTRVLIPGEYALGDYSDLSESLAEWTFMVYMAADNDLEYYALVDFLEMAVVGSSEDVHIVVQLDRALGEDNSFGDWTGTRRGRVRKNDRPYTSWGTGIGEANTGDPNCLIDFATWSMNTFPARHYALVLWNHGNGWRKDFSDPVRAVCSDFASGGNALHMEELEYALSEIVGGGRGQLDMVGFDACLMGMVEVAHQIAPYGKVMVASEELEPADGWPYEEIFSALVGQPDMTAAGLGTLIVDAYYTSYSRNETLSAVDLSRIPDLSRAVAALGANLTRNWRSAPSECVQAAETVRSELERAVIHEHHGASWPGAQGLAIYFPGFAEMYEIEYDNRLYIRFPDETGWNAYLYAYYQVMMQSWVRTASQQVQTFGSDGSHVDLGDLCVQIFWACP